MLDKRQTAVVNDIYPKGAVNIIYELLFGKTDRRSATFHNLLETFPQNVWCRRRVHCAQWSQTHAKSQWAMSCCVYVSDYVVGTLFVYVVAIGRPKTNKVTTMSNVHAWNDVIDTFSPTATSDQLKCFGNSQTQHTHKNIMHDFDMQTSECNGIHSTTFTPHSKMPLQTTCISFVREFWSEFVVLTAVLENSPVFCWPRYEQLHCIILLLSLNSWALCVCVCVVEAEVKNNTAHFIWSLRNTCRDSNNITPQQKPSFYPLWLWARRTQQTTGINSKYRFGVRH